MRNKKRLVFSVYSHELENYPYYPFIANSIKDGITKFVRFCNARKSICEGAELHWIGTCECYYDKSDKGFLLENIQPLMIPQRIEFRHDFFGRLAITTHILGVLFADKVRDYVSVYLSGLCRSSIPSKITIPTVYELKNLFRKQVLDEFSEELIGRKE